MDFSQDVLSSEEQAIMRLRSLYRQYGYTQYKMSRFEEYGLYAGNKAFLASGDIITFTGAGGRLMALRPDVTLSIVKNTKDDGELKKLYYNENIYRPDGYEFKEQMQVGLECIGDIDVGLMGEVLMLARRSLESLGGRIRLDVSHIGFLSGLLHSADLNLEQRAELLRRISEKNAPGISSLCAKYGLGYEFQEKLAQLVALYGPYDEAISTLRGMSVNEDTQTALRELEEVLDVLKRQGGEENINLDFSIVNDLNYYNGIIFQGYIEGIPKKILSGGRYDELLRKFGKNAGAVGFAVYLDLLEQSDTRRMTLPPLRTATLRNGSEPSEEKKNSTLKIPNSEFRIPNLQTMPASNNMISIALPKGRLGEKAYAIFEGAGYGCPAIHEESRKLVFESPETGVRYFWVKPSDVAIYVERGAADIGVAGKDVILEYSSDVYELLDLDIGKCRMCVAAERGFAEIHDRTLRVATKFSNIARYHYEKQGREIDVIKLAGSIELAPVLGLSDVIVDIVETGKTLEENNLETVETIVEISARLVSNKASYKFKHEAISKLCEKINERIR